MSDEPLFIKMLMSGPNEYDEINKTTIYALLSDNTIYQLDEHQRRWKEIPTPLNRHNIIL